MAILKKVWRMFDLCEIVIDNNSYTSHHDALLRVTRETGQSVFVAERVAKPDKIDVRLTGERIKDWNAVDDPIERLWKKGASFTILVKNGSNDLVVIWKRMARKGF